VLPRQQSVDVRYRKHGRRGHGRGRSDANTRALFVKRRQSRGQYLRTFAALAEIAHAPRVPLIVDNTVATPALLRPIRARRRHRRPFAHQIHGRTRARRSAESSSTAGVFRWRDHSERFPMFNQPGRTPTMGSFTSIISAKPPLSRRARSVYQRTTGAVFAAALRLLAASGHRDAPPSRRTPCRKRSKGRRIPSRRSARRLGELRGIFRQSQFSRWRKKYFNGRVPSLLTFGVNAGSTRARPFTNALRLVKRLVNIGRRQIARLPPGRRRRIGRCRWRSRPMPGSRRRMIRLSIGIEHYRRTSSRISTRAWRRWRMPRHASRRKAVV